MLPGRCDARPAHDEGHPVNTLVRADMVRVDAVFTEGVAVIARDDHGRVLQNALPIQFLQNLRHAAVRVSGCGPP